MVVINIYQYTLSHSIVTRRSIRHTHYHRWFARESTKFFAPLLAPQGDAPRTRARPHSRENWGKEAFPWLSVRECFIGFSPATVMAVSFSGEMAYEIHIPNESLYAAYQSLTKAGKEFGMQIFGARAVESMRMEKGFLAWKHDLITEYDPFETGLHRFTNLQKEDFIGKAALQKRFDSSLKKKLVCLNINCKHAPAPGGASLMDGDKVVGTISSGEWGYRVNQNLAYAFVNIDKGEIGTKMNLDLFGKLVEAEVIPFAPYDSNFSRILA